MSAGRVAVFIDGKSMLNAQQLMGFNLDFRKVLETIQEQICPGSLLHNAFYYIGVTPGDEKKHSFATAMSYMGVTVRTKEIFIPDRFEGESRPEDEERRGVNMDFDMAADIFACTKMCDTFVFMTGHQPIERILEDLRAMGKETILLSTNKAVHTSLVNLCDAFVDLQDYEADIVKDRSPRRSEETL